MQHPSNAIVEVLRETLAPNENEVRALVVPNDDPLVCGFSSFLTKQQRARCRRFHDPADRHASMVCKGLWRIGAGILLGCDPRAVLMEHDEWGRPVLIGRDRTIVDLNVSRTRSHCALVVARGVRVGIDIEAVAPELVTESLIRAVSPGGEGAWGFLEDPDSFFEFWTQKEAVLKADGRGLGVDPRQVVVDGKLPGGGVWSLCGCHGESWWVRPMGCFEGMKGAVGADRATESFVEVEWAEIANHGSVRGSCARSHVMNR